MPRHFTLAGLLLWVTFVALVLAVVVPAYRWQNRSPFFDTVVAIAASADGSTFAALTGEGMIRVWDRAGRLKATLPTKYDFGGASAPLELSSNGRYLAVPRDEDRMRKGKLDIDVWDLGTVRRLKTLRGVSFVKDLWFLPDERGLAVRHDDGEFFARWQTTLKAGITPELIWTEVPIQIYRLTDDGPPVSLRMPFRVGRFSPDGERFAGIADANELWIYNIATSKMTAVYTLPLEAKVREVVWSCDGARVSLLQTHVEEAAKTCWQTIENIEIASGKAVIVDLGNKNGQLNVRGFFHEITYLPNGRAMAVISGAETPMKLLDAKTLKSLAIEGTEGIIGMAAGNRGDTFVAASAEQAYPSSTRLDVWDLATLRPRLRLFEQTAPNLWPAAGGLTVWLAVFIFRYGRQIQRVLRTRRAAALASRGKKGLAVT